MTILFILIALAAIGNMIFEFKRDLMMMQQNSYRRERYMKWLSTSGDTTSVIRLCGMGVFLFSLVSFASWTMGMVAMVAFAGISGVRLLGAVYKKPLVWTPRAKRIFSVMCVVAVVVAACITGFYCNGSLMKAAFLVALSATGLYCASHLVMMLAVWLLQPVEKRINKGYYDDAYRILRSMPGLMVIGITGSYGKTSTKHYLNRILSESFNVLMTPGSYNTTMGVIRTVREMMQPYTEIFICEMGAKNIGDIKEICDLVHPKIGIVTAVGEQHLESFKSIENVQRTKFELVDSLPADGIAFVNNDFPFVANRKVENVECCRYSIGGGNDVDYHVTDMVFTPDGTDFTLVGPFGSAPFHTKLIGEFNISSLIPAIAVAIYLGVPLERIQYAVAKIDQVEHRLSLRRIPGSYTIIDDAFNSNPDGSRMALDVLSAMTAGKRIVVTPGMIELGEKQYEYNENFGRKIASSADIAVIVGVYNRDAILSGLRDAGMPEDKVYAVDTFNDAQRVLASLAAPGDTVLYENDLPDTFK